MENYSSFLSTKQAAEFLGLTLGYLYKLTMAKKIPCYKPFGNRLYFKRAELEKMIEAGRIATEDEQTERAITHTLLK